MVAGVGRRILVSLALVGMLGTSGMVLSRIYSEPLTAEVLFGAAVAVVAVSASTRRLPAWSAAPISVVCLVGYVCGLVWLSASRASLEGSVTELTSDALRNGLPRLLTAMIPIDPQPDTLVLPAVALWIAGLAASELALRGRRVLLAYLPVLVFLGACLYIVGPNATPSSELALGFAGCAVVGLAASASGQPEAWGELGARQRAVIRLRAAGGTAMGLVTILVAGMVFGPVLASHITITPADPRQYVTPPEVDSLDESPLARLSGWALDPAQHLFDIDMSGGSQRVRLAVMSDFDGVTWQVNGNYRTAGRVLTGPPDQAEQMVSSADTIEQTITIDQLDGKLVPSVSVPESIEGIRIAYDSSIATMVLPDGLSAGLTYTVVSRPSDADLSQLPTATVPDDAETISQYIALQGEVPSDIERLAGQIAEGIDSPYSRALAVETFISEHYELVADAPSGHAYPNLSFFLFGDVEAGGQKGTSEQFATSFAVLARALGLPTRVAVGFAVADGQTSVTAADAFAWPEVLFEGVGWVAFDPLPKPDTEQKSLEDDFKPSPEPSPSTPTNVDTSSSSAAAESIEAEAAQPAADRGADSGPGAALLGALIAAALVCCYAGVPLAIARRRRARLRGTVPSDRVLGAWREIHDALRLAGTPAPTSLAATEVCEFATATASVVSLVDLATLVNQVTFAPGTTTSDQADRAAQLALDFASDLRAQRPRWRRVLWTLDPRPLWWRD